MPWLRPAAESSASALRAAKDLQARALREGLLDLAGLKATEGVHSASSSPLSSFSFGPSASSAPLRLRKAGGPRQEEQTRRLLGELPGAPKHRPWRRRSGALSQA